MDFFRFVHETPACIETPVPDEIVTKKKPEVKPVQKRVGPKRGKGIKYADEFKMSIDEKLRSTDRNAFVRKKGKGLTDLESTLPGSFVDVNDLKSERVEDIKRKYYEHKIKLPCNLLIDEYKKKIITLVENNEVTLLTGPTGCGKTTQVPQYLLDANIGKGKYCNIVVTQPRRIGAISIAKRVAEERGWELGSLCGYKVGLKNCTSEDTCLTFVTAGILLQSLITKKSLNNYTHILLDEVHERDQTMDFILIVIKKLLYSTPSNVKIVLMSATMESEKFSEFFQSYYCGKLIPPPIIDVNPGTNYPVKIFYLDDLYGLGKVPFSNNDPKITNELYDICVQLIKRFDKFPGEDLMKNSVLVFLPGMYEIECLYGKLTDRAVYSDGNSRYKWTPLPLHSSITIEEQSQVFLPAPPDYRKIILATNIAESSITVPGVKFVIDFCLMKRLKNEAFSNFSSIQLFWASKTSCKQRAGRVGRVMEGQVYRMVKKDFYEQNLPEMLTTTLEKVVLQVKVLNMGEPREILALAPDPPDLSNIEGTILLLKEVGGLLRTRNGVYTPYDGDLTFLGYLMCQIPVDVRITRLIILGYIFSCLRECIIIGAALSVKSFFSNPFKAKIEAYNSKLTWADGSCSDCIAFLNAYEIWCNNTKTGYFQRSKGDNEYLWAKRYFIQLSVLKEVKLLVDEITSRLKGKIEEHIGIGKIKWEEHQKALVLKTVIAGAFYPNYFGRGRQGGNENEANAVKILGGRDPFTTVMLSKFPPEQPIELYANAIKEKLSGCMEEMRVTSDHSSKVYIQFSKADLNLKSGKIPFNEVLPGKISMGVYRAVKIGRVQKSINIKLLPIDKAREVAESLGIKRGSELLREDVNNLVEKNVIPCPLPSINVSQISIVVTHLVDPGRFWACYKENSDIQNRIFCILNKNKEDLKTLDVIPDVGSVVVAPFTEDESTSYYRARVQSVDAKGPKPCAKVFFIDYGNSAIVELNELREVGSELKNFISRIPAQCFECVLCKIQPSLIKNPKGIWSDAAYTVFENLVENEDKLIGKIYSVANGVVSLELFTTSGPGLSVNKILVEEGFAEPSEENCLSQYNHELRKEKGLDAQQKRAYSNLQGRERLDSSSVKLPKSSAFSVNVELKGPYSPLEMKVFPYIRSCIGKTVTISNESVNSVLLDTSPQEPQERLLVAGFVNQSRDNTSIVLNTTTLMPNIHGLATIISCLFAPLVELKMDPEETKYTGILCGLGVDEGNNSVFPEHDFENYFDCEITVEDLEIINRIRYSMSLILMTEKDSLVPRLSRCEILKYQKEIQSHLILLFSKQRKPKEVEFYDEPYKWSKLSKIATGKKSILSTLHNASIFPFIPHIKLFQPYKTPY